MIPIDLFFKMSVYDNEHCGDHLDIMSNFDLSLQQDGEVKRVRSHDGLYSLQSTDTLPGIAYILLVVPRK